ncbi:hypothetical protein OF83DRAFT_1048782 [Amylostereum chailletii]|nr:hypothetical protein OF83DRAFT_1048782 [Amylostereum chailletii]
MAFSEIDDIFASKDKAKPSSPVPSSSAVFAAPPAKKKKKQKKRKRDLADSEAGPSTHRHDETPPQARPVPETVVDPSVQIVAPSKRPRIDKGASVLTAKKKPVKTDKDDEARFKDSRGSGPRRKTEDGFSIYKEDELGIQDEGGDTPLCPFDCDCCASAAFSVESIDPCILDRLLTKYPHTTVFLPLLTCTMMYTHPGISL